MLNRAGICLSLFAARFWKTRYAFWITKRYQNLKNPRKKIINQASKKKPKSNNQNQISLSYFSSITLLLMPKNWCLKMMPLYWCLQIDAYFTINHCIICSEYLSDFTALRLHCSLWLHISLWDFYSFQLLSWQLFFIHILNLILLSIHTHNTLFIYFDDFLWYNPNPIIGL